MTSKTLSIAITPRCNLQCDFCYTGAIFHPIDVQNSPNNQPQSSTYKQKELAINEWGEILKEAQACGYNNLHIFGGEPFLSPNLRDFCQMAFRMGFRILISTNGISFRQGDEDWIKKCGADLSITINEIDIKWSQQLSLKRDWLVRLSKNGVPITISTCLTTQNMESYEIFLEEASHVVHGENWGFFGIFYSPIGRGQGRIDLSPDPVAWRNLIKQLCQKYPLRIEQSYATEKEIEFEGIHLGCPIAAGDKFLVDWYGRVYPCFLLINNAAWMLGKWCKTGDLLKICSQLPEKMHQIINNHESDLSRFDCPAYFQNRKADFRHQKIQDCQQCTKISLKLLCPLISF